MLKIRSRYVRFDLRGLDAITRVLRNEVRTGMPKGPARTMLIRWSARYLGFLKSRFYQMSRGGWTALAPSTLARRMHARSGYTGASRSTAILVDRGFLVKALSPGSEGNLETFIDGGIRVGFNTRGHADKRRTYAEIAVFHDQGMGSNPKREILVPPDGETILAMQEDLRSALKEIATQRSFFS